MRGGAGTHGWTLPKTRALALLVVGLVMLAACSSGTKKSAPSSGGRAPSQVTANATGGSQGVGPIVVPEGRQDVVLPDRSLTVRGATRQPGARPNAASIRVDVEIQNTGSPAIANDSTFFQMMGAEGDIFGGAQSSSTSFGVAIEGHTSRTGAISFDIPAAAASGLRLLYRPGVSARTVMIPLHVG